MNKIVLLVLILCAWGASFGYVHGGRNKSSQKHMSHCDAQRTSQGKNRKPGSKQCPQFKALKPHGSVSLQCPVAVHGPSYVFYHKNKIIDTTNTRYQVVHGALLIRRATLRDSGMYACYTKHSNGSVDRANGWHWVVSVMTKPRPLSPAPYKEMPAKKTALFSCPVKGGTLRYSSSKNGKKVSVPGSDRLVHSNFRDWVIYHLGNLNPDDSGYYFCGYERYRKFIIVKNVKHLRVRALPEISRSPNKQLLVQGESVLLTCHYEGPQNIFWFKDGKKINEGQKSLPLLLRNLQGKHSGVYECRVIIGQEVGKTSTTLDVFAVKGSVDYDEQCPKTSSTCYALVKCEATKNSNTFYSLFYKPYNKMSSQKMNEKKYLKYRNAIGVLFLIPLREGEYTCTATHKGRTVSKIIGGIWI